MRWGEVGKQIPHGQTTSIHIDLDYLYRIYDTVTPPPPMYLMYTHRPRLPIQDIYDIVTLPPMYLMYTHRPRLPIQDI